ncbi:MAG: sigma-70 family RNA polymerase sigma factor [Acidobacteriaceae bacterium]|nr:sigma-70 family RNA polymerase sigma factor [Acidobacteriaceae bacterium]MBV9780376.1 sigma-70 family RNA polymerase sigma factor [Acidobacteriaceae bacterium]
MSADRQSVTSLLRQWSDGNKQALDDLMPLVYDQLRKAAARYLNAERRDHTLQATALVNEAYVRLVASGVNFRDRLHFYALSGRLLRRILVDHAREHATQKRGAGAAKIPLEEAVLVGPETMSGLLELDQALRRLNERDPRKSEIVELLYFGGLTHDEAAAAMNVSPATILREWRLAKAWLYREMASEGAANS